MLREDGSCIIGEIAYTAAAERKRENERNLLIVMDTATQTCAEVGEYSTWTKTQCEKVIAMAKWGRRLLADTEFAPTLEWLQHMMNEASAKLTTL